MIMLKNLLIFSLFIIPIQAIAMDYTFTEKAPADRVYNEDYQGIDIIKQQQRFIFDPKKKVAEEDRRYEDLLAQKQQSGEWDSWNNGVCHHAFATMGCSGEPAWLHDPQQLKHMIEQAKK
ncbi:hypothetical protein G3341_12925 [Providencia vermicola]|nr:hypothetical protein [Providencia stuartii]MBG5917908.1 hypothetical protein [Providencia stuartii]QIC16525.1 hypothetical protein G3341_12925 [Providencia vermicola]